MGNLSLIDTVVLVVYFIAMAAIGPLFASKSKTTEGYFLGDRNFPGWLIGFSMFATSISSITFMSYPADAYTLASLLPKRDRDLHNLTIYTQDDKPLQ